MTYLPPTFQKILGDWIGAQGMKPYENIDPRPPEEVRELLANQPANESCSADAI